MWHRSHAGWASPLSCSDQACVWPSLSCCPLTCEPAWAQTPEPGSEAPSAHIRGKTSGKFPGFPCLLNYIFKPAVTHLVFVWMIRYSLQVTNQKLQSVEIMIRQVSDLRKWKKNYDSDKPAEPARLLWRTLTKHKWSWSNESLRTDTYQLLHGF